MQWLSTGIALVALSGCVLCVMFAFAAKGDCEEHEHSLRRSLGRIAALEAELDVIAKQLQKLRGRVYATKGQDQEIEIARPFTGGIVCENWIAAQRDGPTSIAARCECEYCNAKRAEREALRAKFVPKTNSERKDAIEKGRRT